MTTTLMCEPPLLCYWTWAIVFWLWGSQRSRWFFLISAILTSAAIMTKLTALALIPLLLLHSILKSEGIFMRLAQLLALVIPITVMIAYNAVFTHLYGLGAFQHAADYSTKTRAVLDIPFSLRIIDTLVFIGGGGAIACMLVLILIWRVRASIALLLLTVIAAFVLASSALPPVGWVSSFPGQIPKLTAASICFYLQFILMLALGAAAAIHCVGLFVKDLGLGSWHDDAFLLAWMGAVFVFAGLLNWSINARSILPLIPPLSILVVRGLDRVQRLPPIRTAFAVTLGGALALAVTIGDYKSAATVKLATEIIPREAPAIGAANPAPRLWFVGHWGFQYYMEAAGYEIIDGSDPKYRVGDYVLIPNNPYGGILRGNGFQFVRNFSVGTDRWVSTAQPSMGAGFYHSDGYALPFVFGPIPRDSFALVQVTPESQIAP